MEKKKMFYHVFVDLEKAFDSSKRSDCMGIDKADRAGEIDQVSDGIV